jgi:hypothetical protein
MGDRIIRTEDETDDTSEAGTKRHRGDENTCKSDSRGFSTVSRVKESLNVLTYPLGYGLRT